MPYLLDMDVSNISKPSPSDADGKSIGLPLNPLNTIVEVIRETNECEFVTDDEDDFLSVEGISTIRELS